VKKVSIKGQEFRAGVGAWLAAGMVVAGKGVRAGFGLSTSTVDEEILETPARSLLEDDRAVQGAL
jgi:hypothetical protein